MDEEPVLQFAGKRKVMLLRAAAQECSAGYHKRISFLFLESSRTAKGSWDSFNFPQVSRMRLRKESKRPAAFGCNRASVVWCRRRSGFLPLRKPRTDGSIRSGLPVLPDNLVEKYCKPL